MNLILLHITSFVYIILLAFFYFRKNRISNVENKIYKNLLISNIAGLLIDLLCFYTVSNIDSMRFMAYLFTRVLLIYYIYFISIYTTYVFVVCFKKEKDTIEQVNAFYNKVLKYCLMFFAILSCIITFLPQEYFSGSIYVYTYGPAINFLQAIFVIAMLIWIFVLFKKYKNIKIQKYLPIIAFVLLAGIAGFIQSIYPYMLLTTPIETLIIFLMYFTIENPDMKLLEEVHKSKEISDNANEEKTMFLYNMTQDIRSTAHEIDNNANIILDSDDIDEIKDCAREIKRVTSKFNSMTNNVLDISNLDSTNIKVYNSKYNVKNILKEIVTMYTNDCKKRNLSFKVNIDHDIPDVLYGDSIGLKEVLTVIIDNSVKYTNEGFIEFDVNTIIKNDVCRLMFTIEDSGIGMKSEDINNIKLDNKSLNKANKLITLMNGTMMISSNYGFGTKVKVILDQKIELSKNKDVEKYDQIYDNINLLMVDDSDSGIKIIQKLIKGSNIKMDFAMNGKECLDRIKVFKNYDVILLDEQLSQVSAIDLIKKIKEIINFDIPVILLTKDNSYEYNDGYKELGFSGYLLKPVKKEALIEKIKECTKKDN